MLVSGNLKSANVYPITARTADVSDCAVPAMARAVMDGTEAAILLLVAALRNTEESMVLSINTTSNREAPNEDSRQHDLGG